MLHRYAKCIQSLQHFVVRSTNLFTRFINFTCLQLAIFIHAKKHIRLRSVMVIGGYRQKRKESELSIRESTARLRRKAGAREVKMGDIVGTRPYDIFWPTCVVAAGGDHKGRPVVSLGDLEPIPVAISATPPRAPVSRMQVAPRQVESRASALPTTDVASARRTGPPVQSHLPAGDGESQELRDRHGTREGNHNCVTLLCRHRLGRHGIPSMLRSRN